MKHSDVAFKQAEEHIDKMTIFDQNQILDGLYQDVVSDENMIKIK